MNARARVGSSLHASCSSSLRTRWRRLDPHRAATGASTVGAVIAVKDLRRAKTRLAGPFSSSQRQLLVLAMLQDTIAAVQSVPAIGPIAVVTPDQRVAQLVTQLGVMAIDEPIGGNRGERLNAALSAGERSIRDYACNVVVLQGDLPSARARDLAHAVHRARSFSRSFVADRHGAGTVMLFGFGVPLRPQFGTDSAARHRETGAIELTDVAPGLCCDIDTVADLRLAAEMGCGPATQSLLDGDNSYLRR